MINAGLLAVLLVAALTTQEELPVQNQMVRQEAIVLPKFEEAPLYQELPVLAMAETPKELDQVIPSEPLVHKLPPLVAEQPPIVVAPPVPQPAPKTPSLPNVNEVVVKKGDTLEKIAKQNHTTIDEIIKLNHLPSSFLKIGQVLKIPLERSLDKIAEKKPAELGPEYYTIKVGENPWAIAIRHHMKLEELLKLNGLNEEKARKLKPGDRLRIR